MASSSYLVFDPKLELNLAGSPDNYLIDGESGYSIDEVRKMIKWSQRKPFNRTYKLGLIKQAEQLGIEAQNALLKTLEEPPTGTFLILSTISPENLLETIRSRCHPISIDELMQNQIRHQPDDSEWIKQFFLKEPKLPRLVPFPQLKDKNEAMGTAEKLGKLDRETLQFHLEQWLGEMGENPTEKNLKIADYIIEAKEYLTRNTNKRLTLEVLLTRITGLSNT